MLVFLSNCLKITNVVTSYLYADMRIFMFKFESISSFQPLFGIESKKLPKFRKQKAAGKARINKLVLRAKAIRAKKQLEIREFYKDICQDN